MLTFALSYALSVSACGLVATAAARPNIVLIMADDMGYSDLGCYGSEISTPSLDRLAGGGLRFTQFYNNARCCPTRASLLTGLYPHQAGVGHMVGDDKQPGYRGDLSPNCVTIAEALKPAGYATYMVGKWHVTHFTGRVNGDEALASQHNWPLQRGFDTYYGLVHGGGTYFNPLLVSDNQPVKPLGDSYYLTDDLTDHAVQAIGEHASRHAGQPFFLYLAYTAPHWPLHARPEDIARYKGKYDEGWDVIRTRRFERMMELGILDSKFKLTPRAISAPAWEKAENKEWQARRMEVYAAQIDRMDQGIGRVIAQLEHSGLLDNTLILFLADNGGCAENLGQEKSAALSSFDQTRDGRPMRRGNLPDVMPGPGDTFQSYGLPWANVSNTPFRLYKHWTHEGGISTPLIAYWPRVIKKAGLTPEIGHVIDLMATCIDVAAATYPTRRNDQPVTPLAGRSLVPVFHGDNRDDQRAFFWEHEGNRAVRQGEWKLVSQYPGKWELYNMRTDRSELNDLAASQPDRVSQLARLYESWANRTNVMEWERLHPRTK